MSARLIERLSGVPWAIYEPALQTILEVAGREPPDPANLEAWKGALAPASVGALSMRPEAPMPGARRAGLRDGVAVLRVAGPIFRHAGIMTEISGATALADLAHDLALASDDSRIAAILLNVDSPGGEVTGISEMAQAIRAAGGVKPVVAFVEGTGASAAYWLAAAAQEVVAAPTAMLGSLGVVIALTDTRERDARSGVRRHEFVSSQTPGKKADPQTDAGRDAWQRLADAVAAEFLADVAGFRGIAQAELLSATHGGGLILAREAVAAGLADRLGGFEETLARLAAGTTSAAGFPPARPRHAKKEAVMAETHDDPAIEANEQQPAPAPAPAAPAAEPEAPPAGDPVAAERQRSAAIMAAVRPGFQRLAALAVQQGWTADAFTAAQDAAAEGAAAAAQAAAADAFRGSLPAPVAGGGGGTDPAQMPPEERAKAEFAADPKLRAEFGTLERYAAFVKAQTAGRVRLVSRRG